MADEKMQNENKKSLNTREDNVAEDIRREAAGKDAEMAADKTTEKEGAPKKKNLAFVVRPQNSKNSSRLQGKRPGQGRQGQNQGRPNGDGKRPAAGQSRSNGEGKPARIEKPAAKSERPVRAAEDRPARPAQNGTRSERPQGSRTERTGRRAGKELVSIYKIDEMRGISYEEDGAIRIGSLTSFSHITKDPIIQKHINVLGEAVDMVGGPQIRNIGTIGGNTCNGVTSADSASTLHAWDAIVEITGPDGVRRIPIHDFYIKAGVVDLKPAEIQTAIIIPKEAYEGYHGHYIKYAMRNAMDIATTGCSVNVKLSEDKKTIEDVRIAYGVAGPVPMRAPSAEAKAKGKPLTKAVVHEFGQAVLEDINPRDSWRASKAFRQHIATVLAERALTESIRLAGGVIDE